MSSFTVTVGGVRLSYKRARVVVRRALRGALQPGPGSAALAASVGVVALDSTLRCHAHATAATAGDAHLASGFAPDEDALQLTLQLLPVSGALHVLSAACNRVANAAAEATVCAFLEPLLEPVAEHHHDGSGAVCDSMQCSTCASTAPASDMRSPHSPRLVEVVATCAIAAAADATALHWTGSAVTAARLLRVAAFSALLSQPIRRWWRALLDTKFGHEGDANVPQGLRTLRTLVDRGMFIPAMLCLFFTFMRVTEGTPHEVLPCIKAKLLPCLLANWSMQGMADFVHNGWLQYAHSLQDLQTHADALYADVLRPLFVRCGGEYIVVHVWSALPHAEYAMGLKLGLGVLLSDLHATLVDAWCGGAQAVDLLVR